MDYIVEELSIEVTNECNMACIHCSSGSSPKKLDNELSLDTQYRLIEEARDLGATVLSLSGGNPLLYAPLPLLVFEAEDHGYERILIYVTGHNHNGSLISDYPYIDHLLGHDAVTWIFSLHSHEPEMNDWIMGREKALHNIQESIWWLKARGEEVEIHMVPMRPNFRHIPDVAMLCKSLGVDKMSLLRFVPQTRGYTNRDALAMDVDEFVEMQHLLQQVVEDGLVTRLGCPIDFRHSVGLLDEKVKPCHAGDDLILVRPDGSVHPCAAWKSLPADANVRDSSLRYIWEESPVFNAIREFKQGGYTHVSACSNCPYIDSCLAGCPAQRLHAYGKSLADLYDGRGDPLCPIWQGA